MDTNETTTTVTRSTWKAKRKQGFAQGDPRKGTAKMLTFVESVGTCLVPVVVVPDPEV